MTNWKWRSDDVKVGDLVRVTSKFAASTAPHFGEVRRIVDRDGPVLLLEGIPRKCFTIWEVEPV